MRGHDRPGQVSALILVGLGGLLLLSALLTVGQAAADGDWGTVAVTGLLIVLIGFGVLRGVRQLRRPHRSAPKPPDE